MSLPTFKRGDRPSDWRADELNELVRLVRENLPITAGPGLRVGSSTSRGKCISLVSVPGRESADVLEIVPCRVLDPAFFDTVEVEPLAGGSAFHVAKPWLLRITHKLDADYRRAGLRFQAAGSDPTGSIVAIRDSDGLAETWRTTMAYAADDVVYAVHLGDVFDLRVDDVTVTWLDLNIDGRTWAADGT